jgi:ATP-dependent DNA ligase
VGVVARRRAGDRALSRTRALGEALPDGTVLDGEIAVWRDDKVQPFAELQRRIGRKTLGPKLLREIPVVLLAYDLLEWEGRDLRALPQSERRALLDELVTRMQHPTLLPSPMLTGTDWSDLARQREAARTMGVEGMMLKRRDAQYGVGRTKDVGVWWKWKIDPLSIDAVLIYAQRGHGRRASLYSDYTFAVWDGPPEQEDRKLVPFAKAYSGLTDVEMGRVDAIIRKTTVESFGPVKSVKPTLVFELGFEGIARSTRTRAASRCAFRACCGGGRTSRWRRRIRCRRWRRCCRHERAAGPRVSPSPCGGGWGWGPAAYQGPAACRRPRAPIPAFPREGKEQIRSRRVGGPRRVGGGQGWGPAAYPPVAPSPGG